ncbi:double-strand break repair protein AddB [Sphingomicrobium lutaoense]|uniref:ATP-dependent helicase/nuclease subunit B n=1 Tax=Sphingomicrobium lutaoense TaxID=515949 RepID=A0A839YXC9_9SPHN|nr:double-strand break repair protein AddB [Sphingomicrobium lutaoense]MBB3763696.1 ATP-dependent helicase/nuclease subunit B [Sphingomicrobium lutaoense]
MARVYSIPAHRSFADALASGLLKQYGRDGLARGRILLPTNRAVRSVTEAFVRLSDGGLLLPRMVPIGDPEIGDRIGAALDPAEALLPPAIPPLERQLKLAVMLREGGKGAGEAMRLAANLGRTLDALEVEEVTPAQLRALQQDTPELAEHWERMLGELALLFDRWPRVLEESGHVDMARRRNLLLRGLAERWKDNPPPGFTVAAGISTTAPAVAGLLGRVARMPEGMVVLPALAMEREMPEEEWEALRPEEGAGEPTHPQYHLRLLLDRMGIARGEVETWSAGGRGASRAERGRAAANAMASARFSDKWEALADSERRLSGVRAMELPDPASEAMAIAIALRGALDQEGRTAALVTPDRELARRVASILERWQIKADDSAGTPLHLTPPGSLMMAMLELVAADFSPLPLVALLKHPLIGGQGEARGEWLARVRRLDLGLRGPRPEPGLEGIDRHVETIRHERLRVPTREAWEALRPSLEALAPLGQAKNLSALMSALREAIDALAGPAAWKGSAGAQAGDLLSRIENAPDAARLEAGASEWPRLVQQMLREVAVRPSYGGHPRLFIWGLLEARLQQADLMILGGLNEGSWPAAPSPDPWLAPKLRRLLGLPPLEYRIGLAAHDLMSALGAPQVLLSRAEKASGAPTVASRLWLRLEAMTGGVTREKEIPALVREIDRIDAIAPSLRPAPRPAPALRPRKIYVTDVDRLKADPFAYYAKSMLALRKLDPIDADHHAAWKGSAVHDVLDQWYKKDNCEPGALLRRAEAMIGEEALHPMLRALWRPRLMEAIEWIAAEVERDAAKGRAPLGTEIDGGIDFAGVELRGKADRIDRMADGKIAILDYKTGDPPSQKAVGAGFALQLSLLGIISERGGFGAHGGAVGALEYWSLAKDKNGSPGYRRNASNKMELGDLLGKMAREFEGLATSYLTGDAPFTAMLHPEYSPYGDYDQLMRRDEWYGRG